MTDALATTPMARIEVINDLIVLFELAPNADIEQGLIEADAALGGLGGRPVLVREPESRVFQGVYRDGTRYLGCYETGETVLEAALAKARSHRPEAVAKLPWWKSPPEPGQTESKLEWGYLLVYGDGTVAFVDERPSDAEIERRTSCFIATEL